MRSFAHIFTKWLLHQGTEQKSAWQRVRSPEQDKALPWETQGIQAGRKNKRSSNKKVWRTIRKKLFGMRICGVMHGVLGFSLFFFFLAMLGLCCCTQAVSSYSAWGSHFCDFCCHGAWALLSQAMGDLQGPGIETISLALTAEFLTTGLPGKSPKLFFFIG